jgi:heptosyltransferase-3
MHPTSRWMFKTWTPEGYAAVADHINRNLGLPVILTCAPNDRELAMVKEIRIKATKSLVDLGGKLSLRALGALISRASLFFGVDSAPMHMAAALNIPVAAMFGPSGEHMWGPWGKGHRVIKKDWPCRPCGRDGCEGSKVSRCLTEIGPEEVVGVITGLLEGRPSL